jgi:hypothetical protein
MNDPALMEPTPAPAKKQPNRQRRHVDHFRTDDEEHAELAARARDAGLSVDAFCRLMTLGSPGPRSRRTQPTAASRLRFDTVTAINRIGNLFNQGIRSLHEIRLSAPAARERDRLAYELETLRKDLEKGLGELSLALAAVTADDREG